MKKQNFVIITGLDKYNLTRRSLLRLRKPRILVKVHVKHADPKRLYHLPPTERKKRMDDVKRQNYNKLEKHWIGENQQQIGTKKSPGGLIGWLIAKDLQTLLELPIDSIWVKEIEGRKPFRKKTVNELHYFGVRATYAIQVEGYKTGLQTYAERILLVRAFTKRHAEKIVMQDAFNYGKPYLNSNGELVRWALEKIVDIYDTISLDMEDPVFEVYSELRSRRMKPEYVWNPRRKKLKRARTDSNG